MTPEIWSLVTAFGKRPTAPRAASRAILVALASLASCTAIGPTVQVSPGPDKSQAEFADDRAVCGRATDQQLQPVATRLSVAATTSQQVAANNQWIQEAYNANYT
ncbi:MAG: hypothetical protein ACRYG8_34410, partial [Janthinobacterium lividum]